jgi:hypothetical protein
MNEVIMNQKKVIDRKLINELDDLFEQLGAAKSANSKEWNWHAWEQRVEEIEGKLMSLVGVDNLKDVYVAYAKFYNGRIQFYYVHDYSVHELYNKVVQIMSNYDGGDWLDRMYHSRRIIELLPERYLFSHKPQEKDEKKSDESPAVEIGASYSWGKEVRFHVNIGVIYLLDAMAILDKNGYSMQVVRPASVRSAAYFSEDGLSIREVGHSGYHQLELEVKGREKYPSKIAAV